MTTITKEELIAFEDEVHAQFAAGNIRGPIHLCGGNEDQLIDIFKDIKRTDYIFSTWRHDYHALLHGIPPEQLMSEIMEGRGMAFSSPERNFFTSAIVGGILPIATGVAQALKVKGSSQRVWCFVGDMTAMTGTFYEAATYAYGHDLPIRFIVEINFRSAETPTYETWNTSLNESLMRRNPLVDFYCYEPTRAHAGVGHWVDFGKSK